MLSTNTYISNYLQWVVALAIMDIYALLLGGIMYKSESYRTSEKQIESLIHNRCPSVTIALRGRFNANTHKL